MTLEIRVHSKKRKPYQFRVLNDAVIAKGPQPYHRPGNLCR